jgi:Kef-type K+ transport system membrane component KefB
VAICAAAAASKIGGAALAARATGLPWRESTLVGVLVNTRGLTELIVLDVGLDAGLISVRAYTILVIMALITTAMTGPLMRPLLRAPADEHRTPDGPFADGHTGTNPGQPPVPATTGRDLR